MSGVELGLTRWHAVVAAQDPSGLPAIIAEDAVFHSPAVHAPQPGRDTVVAYLTAALRVLGPHFRYERAWRNESSVVLEFITRLDDREVQGVDIIEFTEDGMIRDFTVLVRPQSALTKLIEHMSAELTRMLGG
jgi:hypothetical protein